jgi:hypothetical protein
MFHSQLIRRGVRGHAMLWFRQGVHYTIVSMLLLAVVTEPAPAEVAEPSGPVPGGGRRGDPPDPLLQIPGPENAWSVSRTAAGCYLISPRLRATSRLAIGWRTQQEPGLFMVGFPLAVRAANAAEPVVVQAGGQDLNESGRMVNSAQLFVPLDNADLERSLHELRDTGTLWLRVRHTWIAHGGQGIEAALTQFGRTCSAPSG